MPLGFQLHHPGGMVENSPAFQRRDDGRRAPSPVGTAEIECFSRPSGTYPSGTSIPALKRRAIIARPSGTEAGPVTSNPSGIGRGRLPYGAGHFAPGNLVADSRSAAAGEKAEDRAQRELRTETVARTGGARLPASCDTAEPIVKS